MRLEKSMLDNGYLKGEASKYINRFKRDGDSIANIMLPCIKGVTDNIERV